MPFRIYEPHPSTPQNTYIHSGRGGFGNHFRAPQTTSPSQAQGPASLFTHGLPTSTHSKFSSGRGGAGNMYPSTEKAVYDFDEELRRQTSRTSKAARGQQIGRGGAGNFCLGEGKRTGSVGSGGSAERRSSSSGFLGRLSGGFERR